MILQIKLIRISELLYVLSEFQPYPMDTFDSYSNISEQNINNFEQ